MDLYRLLTAIGLILLHILQIVIPFIPGHFVPMTAGYVFGVWGIFVDAVGMFLGSFIAYYIGKKYGKKVILKFVDEETFGRYADVLRNRGVLAFFLLFVIPFTPKDALCFIAGALNLRVLDFIALILFIRIPADAVLVLVGAGFRNIDKHLALKLALLGLLVLVIYYIISRYVWKGSSLR